MGNTAGGAAVVAICVLAAACKDASVPPPASPSSAIVTDMFGDAHSATGPAYASRSAKTGHELVYVFEARTRPVPDCGTIDDAQSGSLDLDTGGWVSFELGGAAKLGPNAVVGAGFISGDRSTQSLAVGGGSSDVLTLYVVGDTFDDNDPTQHTTCDIAGYATLQMGNYVVLRFKDFDPAKPGAVTATDADFVSLDSGAPVTKKATLTGVTLMVDKTDNDRIRGTLSGGDTSGSIDAWPCFVDGGPGGAPSQPAQAATDATPDAGASAAPVDSSAAATEDAGASTKGKKKHKK